LDRHAEGGFENKQIDFRPSKEAHFIVLRFNKSVVEHYQVTPHVRWDEVESYELRLEGYGVGMPQSER